MELFDFIKIVFTKRDPKKWDALTSHEKSKFQFMLNRVMSIKYPLNAQQLNFVKTNGLGVAEVWHNVAGRFYGDTVPNFIYTKTDKSKKENSPVAKVPKESIDFWCEKHECGDREFREMLELDEKSMLEELDYITKNFNEKKDKNEQDR